MVMRCRSLHMGVLNIKYDFRSKMVRMSMFKVDIMAMCCRPFHGRAMIK